MALLHILEYIDVMELFIVSSVVFLLNKFCKL